MPAAQKTTPKAENTIAARRRIMAAIGRAMLEIAQWKVEVGRLLNEARPLFAQTSDGTKAFVEFARTATGLSYPSVQRYQQAARVVKRVPSAKKFAGSIETLAFLEPLSDADVKAIVKKAPAGSTETQVREIAAGLSAAWAEKLATKAVAEKAKKRTSAAANSKAVDDLVTKNYDTFVALTLACEAQAKKGSAGLMAAFKARDAWVSKASVSKPLFPRAIERMWTDLLTGGVQPSTQAKADETIAAEVDESLAEERGTTPRKTAAQKRAEAEKLAAAASLLSEK